MLQLFVSRTHSSKDVEKIWEEEWDNTCIFCQHNNRSAGVSIMFKKGLDFTIHDTKFDQNGRYIVIDITLFEQRLTLVCLYGYNTDEPLLFDDILYKIALYANTSILLCGDWNVVQDCNLDTYNILHKEIPNLIEKIEEIIEKLELLDPWRTCHPTDKKFTWRQPSPIKQSRLDYFLVTEDIYSLMKNTKIIPGYKTDHSAIVFTFSASLAKRGKGYWKFNSQLLRDVEYVEKIKTCIKDTISEYYLSGDIQNCLDVKLTCNDQLFFEIMKMKIRTLSISYSIEKNREDREHTSKLEKEVEQLENIMSMSLSVNVQSYFTWEETRTRKIKGTKD
ncbi:E3.1.11.2 [Mytilus coruscus]|uniref:exodeoxyribonuclease III n=1 Tax=Mytilus coruscus TaxID=42192 RepID=A0A6J8EPK3_MYTCO|nr:E3.1.11.2 [Mytilus coruscus]